MKNIVKIRSFPLPSLVVLCALVAATLASKEVLAQDWRIEPKISAGLVTDDNGSLDTRTDQEVELEGLLADVRADIRYSSPKATFFIQPRALLRNYKDEPNFDSDDYFLRSLYSYSTTSNTFGFRVNYDNQSVRTAERSDADLDIDDPDELTNDDSGRTLIFGNRSKWRFSPSWQYQLSNKSSFGVSADFFDVTYDDVIGDLLRPYTDTRLNLNYTRTLSNVTTGLATATTRKYQGDNAASETTGVGFLVGIDRTLSRTSGLTAMIGLEDTEFGGVGTDPEVVGFVRLNRNLETIRMFAQYRRSIYATGAGRLSIRDTLNVNMRRRLNDKISAGLGVRAYQSRGTTEDQSLDDRNYVQIQASFQWYLSQAFVAEVDYRYTFLDRFGAQPESANSNQVGLWLIYQPNTIPGI